MNKSWNSNAEYNHYRQQYCIMNIELAKILDLIPFTEKEMIIM